MPIIHAERLFTHVYLTAAKNDSKSDRDLIKS